METKICSMCKKELLISAFSKQTSALDGLQSRCKECRHNDYKTNKEKETARNLKWNKRNPEKRMAQRKRTYEKHADERRRKSREYYKTYRGRIQNRVTASRRRAKIRKAEGYHTTSDIENQLQKQEHKCFWCQCQLSKNFHIDHVIPISRGGTNFPDNIVISCQRCNQRKHNKLPEEFIIYLSS